jgi:D-serine dehydratase
VLCEAERIAVEKGLLKDTDDDYRRLASAGAKQAFGEYRLSVGSTGNLGLSIGITGSALGFEVEVHMSVEAKDWKKERLRKRGVTVVEHASDYTAACVVAREQAAARPRTIFIDDENSTDLFLGYSVAVMRLQRQFQEAGIVVDGEHPLLVYLPCGVGGAPGGITFGLRHVFGDHAHAFFAEPVEAPCMLLGLLTQRHAEVSVYELGLKLTTDADGLAVSRPSRFVGQLMTPLLSGCYTLDDETLYRLVLEVYEDEGMELEPSAAAGFAGPFMLHHTPPGQAYLASLGERERTRPTHLVWTTGGLFVPPAEHEQFRKRGKAAADSDLP